MNIGELQALLENELSYSVSHASVLTQIGSAEIEALDEDETETVSAIIDAVGQESDGSADELCATVLGTVSDDYIGRKFYDDRGGGPRRRGDDAAARQRPERRLSVRVDDAVRTVSGAPLG